MYKPISTEEKFQENNARFFFGSLSAFILS